MHFLTSAHAEVSLKFLFLTIISLLDLPALTTVLRSVPALEKVLQLVLCLGLLMWVGSMWQVVFIQSCFLRLMPQSGLHANPQFRLDGANLYVSVQYFFWYKSLASTIVLVSKQCIFQLKIEGIGRPWIWLTLCYYTVFWSIRLTTPACEKHFCAKATSLSSRDWTIPSIS